MRDKRGAVGFRAVCVTRRIRGFRTRILEEETQMLAILPEPAATVVAMAAFTGARTGELRGLTWENYDGSEIRVMKSVWRSHVDDPKRPKSKAAKPVIAPLKVLVERHRARCGNVQRVYFRK